MKTEIKEIELDNLEPSPTNPRKITAADQPALKEMAASIKDKGILQPLIVRTSRDSNNKEDFEIVCGERRYTAAKMAGLKTVPCIVQNLDNKEIVETQIIENMQRKDLTPLEEADGYKTLHEINKQDWPEIAARLGKSQDYLYPRLQLLKLIPEFQDQLRNGKLLLGHAEAITRIENPKDQEKLLKNMKSNSYEYTNLESLKDKILNDYLLQLKAAPFVVKDATLPGGACTACVKRTGAQAQLFPELIKDVDTCRDVKCWSLKKTTSEDRIRLEFKKEMDAGETVIVGSAAEKILSRNSYDKPTGTSWQLKNNMTWAEAIKGTEYKPALVVDSKGTAPKLINPTAALKLIPAAKKNQNSTNSSDLTPADKAAADKALWIREIKEKVRWTAAGKVLNEMAKGISAGDLTGLAKIMLVMVDSNESMSVHPPTAKLFGLKPADFSAKNIQKASQSETTKIMAVTIMDQVFYYSNDATDGFKALLNFYKLEKFYKKHYDAPMTFRVESTDRRPSLGDLFLCPSSSLDLEL